MITVPWGTLKMLCSCNPLLDIRVYFWSPLKLKRKSCVIVSKFLTNYKKNTLMFLHYHKHTYNNLILHPKPVLFKTFNCITHLIISWILFHLNRTEGWMKDSLQSAVFSTCGTHFTSALSQNSNLQL